MSLRPSLTGAALAAALLLVLAASGPAPACCVYNDTSLALMAQSRIPGMSDQVIHAGDHHCTEGTGDKNVDLWMLDPDRGRIISTKGTLWVDAGGWITVSPKHRGKWRAENHDGEGKLRDTVYLEPKID